MTAMVRGYLLIGGFVLLGLGANRAPAATPAAELASAAREVACISDAYPETLHGEQTGRIVAVVAGDWSPRDCAAAVAASLASIRVDAVLAAEDGRPGLLVLAP